MKKYFSHLWAQCAVAQQVYNLLEKTSKWTISRRLGSNRKRMKVLSSIHSKKLPPHPPYFYLISLFCESPHLFYEKSHKFPSPIFATFQRPHLQSSHYYCYYHYYYYCFFFFRKNYTKVHSTAITQQLNANGVNQLCKFNTQLIKILKKTNRFLDVFWDF